MEDPATVAAILVEPIGHTGGVIDPPEEYLPILREVCDRHNILLIFDEIITGIGRTGRMFAAETFGVTPDVLCTAKGLSGGYAPLSAMICRRPIADAFWGPIAENPGFVEGHTFEGNPIVVRRRDRRAARDPRARPAARMPAVKDSGCGPASRRWPGSIPSSATSAARGCSRRSSSCATERPRSGSPTRRRSASRSAGGPWPTACCAGSIRTGSRSGRRWSSTAEQIDEMVAILDRSLGEVLAEVDRAAGTAG